MPKYCIPATSLSTHFHGVIALQVVVKCVSTNINVALRNGLQCIGAVRLLALRSPVQRPSPAAGIRGRRCAAQRPKFFAYSSARAQHSLRSRWSFAGTGRAPHGCSYLIFVHRMRECQCVRGPLGILG